MNVKMIFYTIGQILGVVGALMALPLIVSLCYGEETWLSFLIPILILGAIGITVIIFRPKDKTIQAKEGLVIVSISWLLISVFGCLPFFLSREIPNFGDCLFETISGFTTTGASIVKDVESMSYGMLFWRSFTHWIGGMGILVFVLAIIPQSNVRAMHLLRAETTGYKVGKLVSKTRSTARILYGIYIVLTAVEVVFLLCGGMNFFDAVTHSFATAGTGGFSTKNAGIAYFDSVYIEVVISVFMFIFGINFQIFYLILIGNFRSILKNEELRCYFIVALVSMILVACNILSLCGDFATALRYSSFSVLSLFTSTGFGNADFSQWPLFSRMILMMLMFSCACAGSTSGGIKVSRFVIFFKNIFSEIHRTIRPRSVVMPRLDGKPLEREETQGVNQFILLYFLVAFLSVLLISLQVENFETAFSGVISCMGNVGPGTSSLIGPTGNYGMLPMFTKFILMFDMLAGRLELFPIIILFAPATWRHR